MNNKKFDQLEKLHFLGFLVLSDFGLRIDHVSSVQLDDENRATINMLNGEGFLLSVEDTVAFFEQVSALRQMMQLAQARQQSNILV